MFQLTQQQNTQTVSANRVSTLGRNDLMTINSVILISARPSGWDTFATEDASRLFWELQEIADSGSRLSAVICELGVLHPRSLNALNCFLRQGRGLRLYRKASYYGAFFKHKYGWRELQEYLGFRWVKLT